MAESHRLEARHIALPNGREMNETWGIKEAAAFLRIHPDTLAERARAGEIPGCKIGRSWVFMPELLTEYLRSKSTEKVEKFKRVGGLASASLAERLAARRAQVIAGRRSNSRKMQSSEDNG